MIKLFRNKRRGLLAENKVLRYLTYAGGEILLVIIGILVALYINNQNEERKNKEKVEAILVQVYEDLETNIHDATSNLQMLLVKDSLVRLVLNDGLTQANIKSFEASEAISAIYTTGSFSIVDNGFKNWSKIENIPEDYQELVNILNQLFLTEKDDIEEIRQNVVDGVNEGLEYQAKNFDWFADYYNSAYNGDGSMSDEAIDFYLRNPAFKNQTMLYFIYAIKNYLPMLDHYRDVSINAYRSIGELLDLPVSEEARSVFLPTEAHLQKLAGTYIDSSNNTLIPKIEVGENKLIYRLGQLELELMPVSPLEFINAKIGDAARITFKMQADTAYAIQEHQRGQVVTLMKQD